MQNGLGKTKLSNSRMIRRVLLAAFAVTLLPAAEPAQWGRAVNGVRMALSYSEADGMVEITFENTAERAWLLPLGYLGIDSGGLRLIVPAESGDEVAIFTGDAGVAPGSFYAYRDPPKGTRRLPPPPPEVTRYAVLVPLLPRSRYVIRRPTYSYRVFSAGESLGRYLLRHPQVRAEYTADVEPAYRNARCFLTERVWTGKIVSNTLPAPR